ncbi:hypothetical protein GQ53DRAFT_854994 [Thozetella sp. PMI_491]|nr:hypothetical protein GQ53DRAFT_854994 [Thozetella sp. PMI_491]
MRKSILLPSSISALSICSYTIVEEYRDGYPRFCALTSANPHFFIYRRFMRLRSRLLSIKQDKLSMLEQQLDELDDHETRRLYLGKCRGDGNTDRVSLLAEISASIDDYDLLLEKTQSALKFSRAAPRDVISLRNWVDATGCLSRPETQFLNHELELISLASDDSAMKKLEDWVEDLLVRYYKGFRMLSQHNLSTDPSVYLYSGQLIKRLAKAIMLILITVLLLTPVVICILVSNVLARICVIIASVVIYLSILSRLTNSRMIELILAGATFATILTVFVSGVGSGSN